MSKRRKSAQPSLDFPAVEHRRTPEPEPLRIGGPCSFYYEGGHGERYWSGGWHFGIIREIPIKGSHKGWMRIEIPIDHYAVDEIQGMRVRRLLPREKPWVNAFNVNEVWDFIYHGATLREVVAERAQKKTKDVKAALERTQRSSELRRVRGRQ